MAYEKYETVKAMSHDAIFIATCDAILLLRDVKLTNTRLQLYLAMSSSYIKHSPLILLVRVELRCKLQDFVHNFVPASCKQGLIIPTFLFGS